jgi:hypothetical protein
MKLMESAGLPSISIITPQVMLQLAQAAQGVYNQWEVDEEGMDPEYGGGGICQDIAEAMVGVLDKFGIEAMTVDSQGMDDQHVWAVAKFREGVYEFDIPPSTYERGSGYTWTKIPGVEFLPSYISVAKFSDDPQDFEQNFGG